MMSDSKTKGKTVNSYKNPVNFYNSYEIGYIYDIISSQIKRHICLKKEEKMLKKA